jgi:hypothetical protein
MKVTLLEHGCSTDLYGPKYSWTVTLQPGVNQLTAEQEAHFLELLKRHDDNVAEMIANGELVINGEEIAAPVVEAPVVEAPVVEAPVVEAPVVEAPVVEAPVVEVPVVEAPVVEPAGLLRRIANKTGRKAKR